MSSPGGQPAAPTAPTAAEAAAFCVVEVDEEHGDELDADTCESLASDPRRARAVASPPRPGSDGTLFGARRPFELEAPGFAGTPIFCAAAKYAAARAADMAGRRGGEDKPDTSHQPSGYG